MPRPKDPTRARRGTGHRPLAGREKPDDHGVEVRLADGVWTAPEPPEDMQSPIARECWTIAVGELWRRGLRQADLLELRLMCEQYAVAHEAANGRFGFQAIGIVIPDPRGDVREPDPDNPGELRVRHTLFMPNPTVRIGRDAAGTFMRMAGAFGLDIGSRMRLGLMALSGQSLADALQEELERD